MQSPFPGRHGLDAVAADALRRGQGFALLAFAGWGSLHTNFLLGQYYVFLLFLLTLAFYVLQLGKPRAGGFLLGIVFGLKLYGGPFLLYFASKRRWKEAAGMAAAALSLAALAIAIFGWAEAAYFVTDVLPRALAGETLDPYHPGNGTLSTLLRRMFVLEPELNPHPLANMLGLYFFLQPVATLAILIFPLLALARTEQPKRDFSWFVIALLLASPNTASYTFILLLLPLVLLLEESSRREQVFLVACYILLTIPMRREWFWLFPKLWLLAALFFFVGRDYWPLVRPRAALAAAILVTCVAALMAAQRLNQYSREPGRHWERVATEPGAIYSSSPAVLRSGIVYESIGPGHYILRRLSDGRIDRYSFEGEALHPVALSAEGPVEFELVAHGASTFLLLDPGTGRAIPETRSRRDDTEHPARSPDGKWLAFTVHERGTKQVWLRNVATSVAAPLTGGSCNSFSPAWELDSTAVIFASDCGRGLGLPALYRARIERANAD